MPWNLAQVTRTALRRAVIGVALMTSITCDNLDNFDLDAKGTVQVPPASLIETLLAPALTFAGFDKLDFSQEFANQGVTKDQVDSVKLTQLTLTIDAPGNGNFDFLQSIAFSAAAPGLDAVEIARLDSIPKGAKTITLEVNPDAELVSYVVAPSMTISGKVQGQRPNEATTISAKAVFDIDVHVPGCN